MGVFEASIVMEEGVGGGGGFLAWAGPSICLIFIAVMPYVIQDSI